MQKAVWVEQVRARLSDELSIEQKRDLLVGALRRSRWLKNSDPFDDIHDYVEELATAATVEQFDEILADIYDEADDARVWIDLRG